jgi:TPP-dependent pyruvate/acetoin dehydrogenase alpha subunit
MRGAARITQASTTRAAISAAGEEATIVGVTSVMRPDDYLIGTYRTHGHAIAGGTDPKNVMAELFGRVDGTSRGRARQPCPAFPEGLPRLLRRTGLLRSLA